MVVRSCSHTAGYTEQLSPMKVGGGNFVLMLVNDDEVSGRFSNALLEGGYKVIHPNPKHVDDVITDKSSTFSAAVIDKNALARIRQLKETHPDIRILLVSNDPVNDGGIPLVDKTISGNDTTCLIEFLDSFSKKTI